MRLFDCSTCGVEAAVARTPDNHPFFIHPEPAPDGVLVLLDADNDEPTAVHGVDRDGSAFWNVPAGAPRYDKHCCVRG